MRNTRRPHFCFFAILASSLFAGIFSAYATYSGVVAFGDSLSDQGNTISYFPPQSYAGITGYDMNYYNAAYNTYDIAANGRWSSGPTWIEYLNGNLQMGMSGATPVALGMNFGIGSISTDYGSGTNFAFGGSTTATGSTNIFLHNLQRQTSDYLSLIGNHNSELYNASVETTLYSLWSGGNDAIYWVEGPRSTTIDFATTTSSANIQIAITSLYNAGARSFLIPNLPDLGKKPDYIGTQNGEDATAFVDAFNTKLLDVVLSLETTFVDISITFFDVHTKFDLLLSNPETFGFTTTNEAAYIYTGGDPSSTIVADPSTYVFWDSTHPTTQVHQLLGNFAYEMLTIPEPQGIMLFVFLSGMFLVVGSLIRKRASKSS